MLDLFRILLPTLAAIFNERHDLVVENLLLRHQLHIALRSRPRPHLKSRDRFFWLVVRRLYPAWRRHLVLVRPETVSAGTAEAGASTGAGAQAVIWAGLG